MSGPRWLRRRWLLCATAWGTVPIWSAIALAAQPSEEARERVRKKLISLIHDPKRARQVGVVYLQSPAGRPAPPSALPDTVLAEIGPDVGTETIRRYIVARIRRELEEVQVISLDGWIMSATEAQLCALASESVSP